MPLNLINLGVKIIQGISRLLSRKLNKFQKEALFQKLQLFKSPIPYLGVFVLLIILFSRHAPVKDNFSFLPSRLQTNQNLFFEQEEGTFLEIPQSVVIEKNSFKEAVPVAIFERGSLATLAARTTEEYEIKEIVEYVVKEGETLSQIAQNFGISLETILWANELSKSSKILPGQKLTILPVSGVMHLVRKGETVSDIAEKYKGDTLEIIALNELSEEAEVFAGDIMIIPGGVMPKSPSIQYTSQYTPLASSFFICPIPSPCGITQGLHWYNAIDFSNRRCGELVFAAAGGEIQKTGYHSVAGKYIRILHPNGVVTFYGHLSSILVVPGQRVSQGEVLGYSGNTGFTVGATGCHLHFEVRGASNPFAR